MVQMMSGKLVNFENHRLLQRFWLIYCIYSMIQQAEIGVGISGREGVQAALASDFVIGQFRFLSKLLLIHGHWSYYRIGESILNFFFKNMTWVFALFWYQSASG